MEKKMETGLELLRHRKEIGNYYNALYRDYYKGPMFDTSSYPQARVRHVHTRTIPNV